MYSSDVGMIETRRCLGFACEPLTAVLILAEMRGKEFESDVTFKLCILSQIYFTHPTGTNLFDDAVVSHNGVFCQWSIGLRLVIVMILRHTHTPA